MDWKLERKRGPFTVFLGCGLRCGVVVGLAVASDSRELGPRLVDPRAGVTRFPCLGLRL